MRRLGAAALVLGCLIAVPGQAGADDAQTFKITGPSSVNEGGVAAYTVTLTEGTDDTATVDFKATAGSATQGVDYTITPATLTVPEGGNASFTIQTTDDGTDELNESFTAELTNPQGATIETGSVLTQILDNDTPSVSIANAAAVNEGEAASFTLTLSQPAASDVTVTYSTGNGSAVAPGDFTAVSTPTTIAAGATSKTVTVATLDETPALDEETEAFSVALSNVSANASIGTASATGSILDDDTPPSVTGIVDVEVTEADITANLVVNLSGPSGKDITINFGPGEGSTATAGTDFVSPSGTLQIPAGDTQGSIPVVIKEDTNFEGDETVFVNLFGHVNVAPGPDVQGKVTIKDDADPATAPAVPNAAVPEGNAATSDLTFQVTLASPRPQTTFTVRTVAGTANGTDYTEVGGAPLVFPANTSSTATTLPFPVKVKGDTLDENDETFGLELVNPTTGAVVATATGTITNDDNNSKLSISDATADEPGTLKFTVTLAPASAREVKVNWATANGTATAGVDYTAASGALTFAAGATSQTIDVAVTGDSLDEANETLNVNLSGPTGIPAANLLDAQGAGTIVDKNAPPSLSISDTSGREGAGATFTVTLAGTTLQEVKVNFNTADGTAKAGSDYASRGGTLTFAPGEKSKTIAVSITDDPDPEPVEEFFVVLGDPVAGAITKNRGEGSIEASDRSLTDPTGTPPVAKPTAKPAARLVPRMILGPRTVAVGANGIAKMLVTCQKASPIRCAGTVELERAVRPLLKLGKRTFTVKKGGKGYASVKLTARSLKILRKNGTMRVKVIVVVKTSTKTMKVSPGIITLKSLKKKTTVKPKPKPKAPPTQVVVDP